MPDDRLGRRLTREEELKHNIKDVWPEGAVFIGDAATLHEAALTAGDSKRSLLEEVSPVCSFPGANIWLVACESLGVAKFPVINSGRRLNSSDRDLPDGMFSPRLRIVHAADLA